MKLPEGCSVCSREPDIRSVFQVDCQLSFAKVCVNELGKIVAVDWIDVDSHVLRYELRGSGPNLVLIHEMGGMLESYESVVDALAGDFRVLRYDQRGSGLSEKVRGTLTIDELVGELHALVGRLGLEGTLNLAGLALGGSIAIRFAALHPSRVRRLLVTAPAVRLSDEARKEILLRANAVEIGAVREHVEATLPASYPNKLRDDVPRFERLRGQRISADPGSLAASLRLLGTIDIAADLPCVDAPTLMLAGNLDYGRPPSEVELAAKAMPNARLVRIDSGHFIPQHNPEEFARYLREFMKDP